MARTEYWLTTTDNPYDPWEEWEQWYHLDEIVYRYHTTGLMARFSTAQDDAPDYVLQESNKRAIAIIIKDIPLGVEGVEYRAVSRVVEDGED